MNAADVINVIVSLVGVVAILYMRTTSIQIEHLRRDNERIWKTVGGIESKLHSTREDYMTKKDFDGAINRLARKLDTIDGEIKRLLLTSKEERSKTDHANMFRRHDDKV